MMSKTNIKKPELLAPAGDLERLKIAFLYGADAVYLGGQSYGLRSAAKNFTSFELEMGLLYAHERGKKVYVTINSFFHDEDFEHFDDYILFLHQIKVDAVIVSDLGVLVKIHEICPEMEIHLSTQASCLNHQSALFWKKMNVTRIVLGRELGLAEGLSIAEKSGVELEMFCHGSMCMAYSGHCTISNYTAGRDSNRGGCAHSCRFEYTLNDGQEEKKSFFMNSKDMLGAAYVEDFFKYGIASMKIEGRMKGPLYVASVTKAYRELIDEYAEKGEIKADFLEERIHLLTGFVHRDYFDGNLSQRAKSDSVYEKNSSSEQESNPVLGLVAEGNNENDKRFLLEVKGKFSVGDDIYLVNSKGRDISSSIEKIEDCYGNTIEITKPSTLVYISLSEKKTNLVMPLMVARRGAS